MSMKPLVLQAHLKPITWVTYNKEGDLLFVSSKDKKVSMWYTENGDLIGTFEHKGAINCVDVTFDSKMIATASSTGEVFFWDVQSGNKMTDYTINSAPVKTVQFSDGGDQLLCVTEKAYGNKPAVTILDLDLKNWVKGEKKDYVKVNKTFEFEKTKVQIAVWGPCNETFLVGLDDGTVEIYDTKSKSVIKTLQDHKNSITKISFSKDKMLFITCSTDNTAKLYDSIKFENHKTYSSGEPVNTASISPLKDHVILGGGTSAVNVTTTHARVAYFETRFFNLVYEDEFATVKGHFGPIHALAFNPDGKSYVSGGEDGFVKIHPFPEEYFTKF